MSIMVSSPPRCEFCHLRESRGWAITGTGLWKHACKRCADAVFGVDDR